MTHMEGIVVSLLEKVDAHKGDTQFDQGYRYALKTSADAVARANKIKIEDLEETEQ
jgi:hypothetical protein